MRKSLLLYDFKKIKSEGNLTYYDTHVHPSDVFGLSENCEGKKLSPSLLEYFHYNTLVLYILRGFFYYLPAYIRSEIRKKFVFAENNHLLEMLNKTDIDKITLVPIYPHSTPEDIYNTYKSERYINLGSVNIHAINLSKIEESINEQIRLYSIIGIKLHTNIQKFYPEPSLNKPEVKEKIEKIYSLAEKNKLYLLIHGGLSFVPDSNKFKKVEYGLINNFFNIEGSSFLEKINVPVIIAHLGSYNVINPDFNKIGKLSKIDNVYFDTAGISPNIISKFVKNYGSKKIVFGSDSPYFHLNYNIYLVLRAIRKSKADFKSSVSNIFSLNYKEILAKIGR